METKVIENIQTLENLTEAVNYYREISNEISRLELSKKIAEESILEKFRGTGMRRYDTPSGLRARKVGDTIVVRVRPIKMEEADA